MIAERTWAVLQHVSFEGPGLIATIAAERGVQMSICRLYDEDPLPRMDELDGLVVMGGPMSVHDTAQHPYLAEEARLIVSSIDQQIPVLGICLGAQLIAHALGASVYPGRDQEIGTGTVTLTREGRSDPVVGASDQPELSVVHWHGETFDLPGGATLLAESDSYPHQAFRVGKRVYGFQFHLEVDRALATAWAEHLPDGVEITDADLTPIEECARSVLGAFFDAAAGIP
jgi:GMP synthase-like glutamine amidotransferase